MPIAPPATAPTTSRTFQRFGALQNPPVCGMGRVYGWFGRGRIDLFVGEDFQRVGGKTCWIDRVSSSGAARQHLPTGPRGFMPREQCVRRSLRLMECCLPPDFLNDVGAFALSPKRRTPRQPMSPHSKASELFEILPYGDEDECTVYAEGVGYEFLVRLESVKAAGMRLAPAALNDPTPPRLRSLRPLEQFALHGRPVPRRRASTVQEDNCLFRQRWIARR